MNKADDKWMTKAKSQGYTSEKTMLIDLYTIKKLPLIKIGNILGAAHTTICSRLRKYNIERKKPGRCMGDKLTKEQFKQNLLKKYGIGILEDFELAKNNPTITQTSIGKKYGFTREYARQVINKLYERTKVEKDLL